jgi:hypothetical protein
MPCDWSPGSRFEHSHDAARGGASNLWWVASMTRNLRVVVSSFSTRAFSPWFSRARYLVALWSPVVVKSINGIAAVRDSYAWAEAQL